MGVSDVQPIHGKYEVTLENGRRIRTGGVVAGLGITPETSLAAEAGLQTGDGIVVDEFLQTTHPDVLAAGDVASFHSPPLRERRRVEHENTANAMGEAAGRNMAGGREPYDYLPYFYSDLFDLGYEAVGDTNPRYEIVAHWEDLHRKGYLFYLSQGRVRGVVFWNEWNRLAAGRELLGQPGPFDTARLKEWVQHLPKE